MNKDIIKIPNGVEYISQWNQYSLPRGEHCIVDKGVTGCGYTEFALKNMDWVVLCSPRKLLLENKSEKHLKEKHYNIIYLDSLSVEDMFDIVKLHINKCVYSLELPPKLLITYDSTGKLIDILNELGVRENFIFVVDEFQSIFLDSYFKVGIEFDFVNNLQDCSSVIYLSATPMLDKYLEKIPHFKDLPFHKLDWSGTGYVETVTIERKRTNSLTAECCKIVNNYLNGNYPKEIDPYDNSVVVQSKEAVFYFNSVSEILRVINKCKLTPENTIIVCSRSEKNSIKLKKLGFTFGRIPLEDEPNPMFTFCTSAVYMGVDFHSSCASSYVFANPNVECLALDISLDLPQIIGRQRNKNNLFKNHIALFYKTKRTEEDELNEQSFLRHQEEKREATKTLLNIYDKVSDKEKKEYVKTLKDSIEYSKYSNNFVSISERTGKPVYNTLIDIADQRAWDVSQKDYQDTISVTKAIQNIDNLKTDTVKYTDTDENIINIFLRDHFFATNIFKERLALYCLFRKDLEDSGKYPFVLEALIRRITDPRFNSYYLFYGYDGCKAKHFEDALLKEGLNNASKIDVLSEEIYSIFSEGDKITLVDIKSRLKQIYEKLHLSKAAKAVDLEKFFELTKIRVTLPDKSRSWGFKLGKRLK